MTRQKSTHGNTLKNDNNDKNVQTTCINRKFKLQITCNNLTSTFHAIRQSFNNERNNAIHIMYMRHKIQYNAVDMQSIKITAIIILKR